MDAYINTVAHEIMHADDLYRLGRVKYHLKYLFSNRHDEVSMLAAAIESQYWREKKTKGVLYPIP